MAVTVIGSSFRAKLDLWLTDPSFLPSCLFVYLLLLCESPFVFALTSVIAALML